jgi:hypothetical protein
MSWTENGSGPAYSENGSSGASGGGLPTASAAGAVPVSTGAGTTYTATDLAAAVLAARTTTLLASSTGWTLASTNGGTATISGGSLVLVTPSGSSSGDSSGVRISLPGYARWSVQFRVTLASSDTDAGCMTRFYFDWAGAFGSYQLFQLGMDGTLSALSGSWSSISLDGTGWLRIDCDGSTMRLWRGTSTGDTEPVSWTLLKATTITSNTGYAQPARIYVNCLSEGHTSTGTVTATYRNLVVRDLG